MLFCGPTGVGKTQLARSLADYLFGESETNEKPLVRLDMSEYGNWDAVDRFLIGADGEVAPWIGRLRAKPMSVVLLDEFEKSSPEVHDCLLSALDEGRVTDRFGRTTTLCGAIVILTSNVGSRSTSSVGFGENDARAVRRAVEHEFRPEFLNRLDELVTFDPLPPAVIEQIVEKELQALSQRETLQVRRVQLSWDESIVKRLAAFGFDPLLGARPLQRAIEREVVAKIARRLLSSDNDAESISIDLADLMSV
jgi:ATP-dependent Clp protease ATP-binding subunit ClpC